MPQVVQFPMQAQTIPVQVPISANGQTIYQTVHVPIQNFGNQIPQIIQPQMQIIPQFTQQVANIITPSGQIQQVQLANLPLFQQQNAAGQPNLSALQPQQMKVEGQEQQPITITNAQGQPISVFPASALRPNQNANIIQIPNFPTSQQIQHIPGIGNVQVISANALSGANFMAQPMQTIQQIPQSPVIQNQAQAQQTIQPATSTISTPTSQPSTTQTITITPQSMKQVILNFCSLLIPLLTLKLFIKCTG
jgi:transcription factor Sp